MEELDDRVHLPYLLRLLAILLIVAPWPLYYYPEALESQLHNFNASNIGFFLAQIVLEKLPKWHN